MTPDPDDGRLVKYRVDQIEKRQERYETDVSQIRDAILGIRNDSTAIRNRLTLLEEDTRKRTQTQQHRGEFRWTKVQVLSATLLGLLVVVLQVYVVVKR